MGGARGLLPGRAGIHGSAPHLVLSEALFRTTLYARPTPTPNLQSEQNPHRPPRDLGRFLMGAGPSLALLLKSVVLPKAQSLGRGAPFSVQH